MSTISRLGVRDLVDLGDVDTELAFQAVNCVQDIAENMRRAIRDFTRTHQIIYSFEGAQSYSVDTAFAITLDTLALSRLFECEWFRYVMAHNP